jgi:hypothetical protein
MLIAYSRTPLSALAWRRAVDALAVAGRHAGAAADGPPVQAAAADTSATAGRITRNDGY